MGWEPTQPREPGVGRDWNTDPYPEPCRTTQYCAVHNHCHRCRPHHQWNECPECRAYYVPNRDSE